MAMFIKPVTPKMFTFLCILMISIVGYHMKSLHQPKPKWKPHFPFDAKEDTVIFCITISSGTTTITASTSTGSASSTNIASDANIRKSNDRCSFPSR